MSERSSLPRRRPRGLADEVRRRVAVRTSPPVPGTPLPLARVPGPAAGRAPAPVQRATEPAEGRRVDRQAEPGAATGGPEAEPDGGLSGGRPTVEEIADCVYQLLLQDLRLERERGGR